MSTDDQTVPPLTDDIVGTYAIGGDLPVRRLGYGAMQITGDGVWGRPESDDEAREVLRRAVELGVNLIDTADSYGPAVSEELIAEALHPYPDDLVIATKAGLTRPGPGEWVPRGDPEYLRDACEGSLRRLRLDTIPLYQLHRIDPEVPAEDSIGALVELQQEGKIRHIGLSEVTEEQLLAAREITPVATVQNRYNVGDREWDAVVDLCHEHGIGFLPWFPMASGDVAGDAVEAVASAHATSMHQVALAWLLHRSPVMLPIPGTSTIEHLHDNLGAATLQLTGDELTRLDGLG